MYLTPLYKKKQRNWAEVQQKAWVVPWCFKGCSRQSNKCWIENAGIGFWHHKNLIHILIIWIKQKNNNHREQGIYKPILKASEGSKLQKELMKQFKEHNIQAFTRVGHSGLPTSDGNPIYQWWWTHGTCARKGTPSLPGQHMAVALSHWPHQFGSALKKITYFSLALNQTECPGAWACAMSGCGCSPIVHSQSYRHAQ